PAIVIALDVLPFPHHPEALRVNSRGASGTECNVDPPGFYDRSGRRISIERMTVLGLWYVKEFQIVEDAPGVTIQAKGIELAAILGRRGQPDLVVIDDG